MPPGDADALATAIAKVMSHPPELAGQLQYAEARARSQYSVDQMLQTVSGLIGRAAAGAPV